MANDLDYKNIKFPVSKKNYKKIEQKNNFCINVFCYENNLTDPVHIFKQTFEDRMDLLLSNAESKSLYV